MVDWHDPAVVAADNLAFIKFVHVMGGVYIWEFFVYLGFEYSVITRKRKFTWSFLLYLGCRWCALLAITLQIIGLDVSHKIDCQAWVLSAFVFGNLSLTFSSALIILRVAAIWDRSKFIITIACAVFLGNIASLAYSISPLRSDWTGSCTISHTNNSRINVLSAFITDIILLVLMLVGLMRWKNASSSCIWRLLRTQCFIWVMIVTFAGLPATVFVILNLNDPMNLIPQVLGMVIASLGAARIHRGLVDFPALNSTAKTAHGTEWAGEHNREAVSPQGFRTMRSHDSDGVKVAHPVTTYSSEVHKTETFEGANIV
jgi:hypothetical protein